MTADLIVRAAAMSGGTQCSQRDPQALHPLEWVPPISWDTRMERQGDLRYSERSAKQPLSMRPIERAFVSVCVSRSNHQCEA